MKCAARGSLEMQDAKNHKKICLLRTITQLCRAISLQLRHYRQSEKKLVKQQYLLHMSSQYGELNGTLAAEIDWRVWGTRQISMGFASKIILFHFRRHVLNEIKLF